MRIDYIGVKDVFQHESREIAVDGNLIGVVGPNGKGKSNILNALRFGFGGEVPGKNKDQLTRWGAKSPGRVTIRGEHDGKKFEISRPTEGTKVEFDYGDANYKGITAVNKAIETHLGLNKDILDAVFVAQAALDEVLFKPASKRDVEFLKLCGLGDTSKIHRDLGQALSTRFPALPDYNEAVASQRARVLEMQDSLAKADTQLQQTESELSVLRSASAIEQRRSMLVRALEMLTALEGHMASETRLTPELLRLTALEQSLKAHECCVPSAGVQAEIDKVAAQVSAAKSYAALTAEYTTRTADYDREVAAYAEVADDEAEAESLAAVLLDSKEKARSLSELTAKYNELQRLLAIVNSGPAPEIPELASDAAVDDLQRRYLDLSATAKLLSGLLSQLGGTGPLASCPLCESEIPNPTMLTQRLRDRISELGDLNSMQLTLAAMRKRNAEAKAAIDARTREVESAMSRIPELEAAVVGFDPATPIPTPASLAELETRRRSLCDFVQTRSRALELAEALMGRAKLAVDMAAVVSVNVPEFEAQLRAMVAIRDQAADIERQLSGLGASIDALTQQKRLAEAGVVAAAEELKALTGVDGAQALRPGDMRAGITAEIDTCRREQSRVIELETLKSGINGGIREVNRGLEEAQKAIEVLTRRKELQGPYATCVDDLTRVRDWFHYAKGPRAVSLAVMDKLTQQLNVYLECMNAPFRAVLSSEDLGYRCAFTDGRDMPTDGRLPEASELSGGQKMLMAIAFRMASYCLFANKQGLLVLDEPTAYLDADNVNNFCELLVKIKEIASQMGVQLLISTHEQAVLPFCDAIINLYEG